MRTFLFFYTSSKIWAFNSGFGYDAIQVYILCKDLHTKVKLYYYENGLEWY